MSATARLLYTDDFLTAKLPEEKGTGGLIHSQLVHKIGTRGGGAGSPE